GDPQQHQQLRTEIDERRHQARSFRNGRPHPSLRNQRPNRGWRRAQSSQVRDQPRHLAQVRREVGRTRYPPRQGLVFNKYYQDELAYLRELGREFAQAYPQLAPMLADRGGDPDVERLLEGTAFLTARVREKLDDELPEAIHAIAELIFPQLVR